MVWQSLSDLQYFREYPNKSLIIESTSELSSLGLPCCLFFSVFIAILSKILWKSLPFSSCFQSCPASESFPMTQLFASGGQSIGASASVLPMNTQGWFPLGLASGFPCCPRDSQQFFPAPQFESINFSVFSFLYGPTITSVWLLGKL